MGKRRPDPIQSWKPWVRGFELYRSWILDSREGGESKFCLGWTLNRLDVGLDPRFLPLPNSDPRDTREWSRMPSTWL